MNEKNTIPVYEVTELSLKQAILMLATEKGKEETIYTEATERLLNLCA